MSYTKLAESVDALVVSNTALRETALDAVERSNSAVTTAEQAASEATAAAASVINLNKVNKQYPFAFVSGQSQYDVGVISGDNTVTTVGMALWVESAIEFAFTINSTKKFTLDADLVAALANGAQMRIMVNARFDDLIKNFDDLQDVFTAENAANYQVEKTARMTDYYNYLKGLQLEPAVPYGPDLAVLRPTQTYTQSGVLYRPKAEFLPMSTTDWVADVNKFVVANDMSLRQELAMAGGDKGASMVYGAARVVDTVADMKALAGIPVGSHVMTMGYFARGDGGANVYTVIASAGVTGDLGTNIVVGPVAFRGEFPNGRVLIKQFGSKNDGVTVDHASFLEGRTKARAFGAFLEFPIGKTLLNPFVPSDKDKMLGAGSGQGLTELIFTTGDTAIHMSNTAFGVRYTMPPAYIKDTRFIGFTVNAVNVKVGIYAVANLFTYFDDVRVINAKICNWFSGYIFGGKWGHIRADYGVGSGFEFGYNRWGWTPGVPGEPAALCHGASILHLDCYGNGIGELSRPPLGSVLGAGAVFADGLSNAVLLYYGEQNFGHGLVTVGDVAYGLGTVYLESNDKYRPEGADRYDYYNAAGEMAVANLGPIFTGGATVWNAGRLVCENFRGVKIDGPGPTKVTGNFRNATISNPSLMGVPLLTRVGTAAAISKGHTLPKLMPADGTMRYFRGGVYQCYPEIVFEAAGGSIAEARIIITNTAGAEVYNQRMFSPVNPAAGVRMVFPFTDFTWDKTQNYRLTLSGVTPYTGELVLSFIADIMA